MFALDITKRLNNRSYAYIINVIDGRNFVELAFQELRRKVQMSDASKFVFYRDVNPNLSINDVYFRRGDFVPEQYRIAFTRMRLSAHRLRIETGRWARLPRERRLCPCGQVQHELHVLVDCP